MKKRGQKAKQSIKNYLRQMVRHCWLGFYEATSNEVDLSRNIDPDMSARKFGDFDKSIKELDEIFQELKRDGNLDGKSDGFVWD